MKSKQDLCHSDKKKAEPDILEMKCQKARVESLIKESLIVIKQFEQINNSYLLEFFVDDHWQKLPQSWRLVFECLDPRTYSELLSCSAKSNIVWPLSLLSLRILIKKLAIRRSAGEKDEIAATKQSDFFRNTKLSKLLSKGIKSKKKHEIDRLAPVCALNARKHSIKYIVDFGAGLGHLARRLSFQYSMKTCCLDMQDQLNKDACKLDEEFLFHGAKYLSSEIISKFSKPVHITMELKSSSSPDFFLSLIRNAFNLTETEEFTFGIVGLHPCGQLSAILINLFLKIKEAKFLCIIGCCYMKLNINKKNMTTTYFQGYPLSQYLLNYDEMFYNLSYESREVACHAIENFAKKLEAGNYHFLKIHAYRAILERILREYSSNLKRLGLKSVKHVENLTFSEYAKLAITGLEVKLLDEDLNSYQIQSELKQWKRVVFFYTLRIMLAPLIESVILYDRHLYLLEHTNKSSISTIFDPIVSPRNHIIIGSKT